MTSQDGLALLKQMHQRGEITDEQYDTLRRHVLWGTPLPQFGDGVPASRSGTEAAGDYVPGAATVGPHPRTTPPAHHPDPPTRPPADPPERYADRAGRYAGPPGRYAGPPGRYADPPGRLPDPPDRYGNPPNDPRGRRFEDPSGRYRDPRDRFPVEPAAGFPAEPAAGFPADPADPDDPADPAGQAPRRYASRRERREAEEAQGRSAYLPPAGTTTGPLPPLPLPEAPPRRRHRRADLDPPPPDDPAPARRHRHAPPGEITPRRERRPAESEPERPRGHRTEAGKRERRPRRRSVVAVLTSVVLALALAAGGVYWFELRRQGLAPPAYARQACGAVRDWQQAVDSSNARLINQISRQQNKATVRADVTAYYTTVAGSTDQLRVRILDLGPADLPGGRVYADSLAAAVGDQASALRRLAGQAGRLDPAAATFQTDLQGILAGADAAVSAVTAALARPAAGITTDLRTTLSNEPACAPYVG